jgi:hypothetical protein
MKEKKPFLNMDERNKQIAYKIISVMYFLTIIAMQIVVLYRQFALGQSIDQFEDIAIIMTVNSLFLICALLYFGAIPVQKIKIKTILSGYTLIIVLGSIFTYVKYNIVMDYNLSTAQLLDKLLIIFAVSGLIVIFFVIFSLLGKNKLEKELDGSN